MKQETFEINNKKWLYYKDAAELIGYPNYILKYEANFNFNPNLHLKLKDKLFFEYEYVIELKLINEKRNMKKN
jgi:hypothetical protein